MVASSMWGSSASYAYGCKAKTKWHYTTCEWVFMDGTRSGTTGRNYNQLRVWSHVTLHLEAGCPHRPAWINKQHTVVAQGSHDRWRDEYTWVAGFRERQDLLHSFQITLQHIPEGGERRGREKRTPSCSGLSHERVVAKQWPGSSFHAMLRWPAEVTKRIKQPRWR